MHNIRRIIEVIFILTLAALLLGGVVFVSGQAVALTAGQGQWLEFFNEFIKTPICITASVCAVAGFLLSYKHPQKQEQAAEKATSR
ncbi:hypothetical protein ACIQC0_13565 [Pseudarthrobacter sp. NPDC092419]|uniref:hypothetical protein n=1 Tax=Pseudarthrobacter sp. NPDC092419 TaxID=3364414 RepID=UPI0038163077